MSTAKHLKMVGARIRSELNDLKRTPTACATELGLDSANVEAILSGDCFYDDMRELIERISRFYPIDRTDLHVPEDECVAGVRFMRNGDSEASSRTFERPDRSGSRTPYYEYRDTAMSRLSPIKPEWIRELRVVEDASPDNPDVAYNNGHFLHQLTFFLGPVNFYYEVDGRRHCVEMNTGDSNYIMPFYKHSFASRDAGQQALIVAVTFGGDVRRAQNELYVLGQRGLQYKFEGRGPGRRAEVQLIEQHLRNENLTRDGLQARAAAAGVDLDVEALFDERAECAAAQRELLAPLLGVEAVDLTIPPHRHGEEVLVRHHDPSAGHAYPGDRARRYEIFPLVRQRKMPLVKGFNIFVHGEGSDLERGFENSLHTYAYNYGDSDVAFDWRCGDDVHHDVLHPGDSLAMAPFVRHSLGRLGGPAGRILSVSVGGAVNLSTQREFACFADAQRVIHETRQWFD